MAPSDDSVAMTDSPMMQNMIATFFFVAYFFLIVVSLAGSVTIIFLVLRYRNLRSRPINFYYVNMAFADLFLASLGAPFRALYYLNMRWTLGPFMCHWFEYAENLGYFVHVYSLTLASFLILQDVSTVRLTYLRNEDTTKSTCLRSYVVSSFGVWTFGILACLPYATFRRYAREQCIMSEHYLFYLPEKLFGPFVLIVIPVTVTIVVILLIICCACTTRRIENTYHEHVLMRTQKSTRHVSLLMLIYILCQIPYFALKWFHLKGFAQHETLQFCAAGLRLSAVCFSAAFFCYISDEKVLYNVRHVMAEKENNANRRRAKSSAVSGNPQTAPDKIPLRSVSDTQYQPPGGQSEFRQDEPDDRFINQHNSNTLSRQHAANNQNNGSLMRYPRNESRGTASATAGRRHHANGDDSTIPLHRREQPETYV